MKKNHRNILIALGILIVGITFLTLNNSKSNIYVGDCFKEKIGNKCIVNISRGGYNSNGELVFVVNKLNSSCQLSTNTFLQENGENLPIIEAYSENFVYSSLTKLIECPS